MMNTYENIDLIESSFTKMKADKMVFSGHFYDKLFEKAPQLKPLFAHVTMKAQGAKLYAALVLLVENLRHPEELERVLLPLGERHKGYGVIEQHYPIVCETLLETLAFFLKEDWTPEVKNAWSKTLDEVTRTMLIGSGIKTEKLQEEPVSKIQYDAAAIIKFELVEQSFKIISPQKDEFAKAFYSNLFVLSPEVKPLFDNTDMIKQAGKLHGVLLLIVENIREPKNLEKVLLPLGAKHIRYGTIESHYPIVRSALIKTLKEFLRTGWSGELEQGWISAYNIAAEMMMRGADAEKIKTQTDTVQSGEKSKQSSNRNTTDDKSKFSSKQVSQRTSSNRFISKANDLFWRLPKWKIALGITIVFILMVPFESEIPIFKGILEIVEPLSIILALILYIKETPARKKQFRYQAWSIVDAANGIKNSYARIIALQDLCDDGVSLKGLELAGAELSGIELNGCDLSNVNFNQASLNNAELYASDLSNADLSESNCTSIVLTKANLGFANLQKANFSSADFNNATLMFTNMREGNFSGANFSNAKLKGADFEGAYFSGANLKGAEVNPEDLEKAYLVKAIMPDGTVHE